MNIQDILNSALKHNAGKSNRSEDLAHFQNFYVDPIDSAILEQNTKQLIYGRRGSGKTLVIGAINEKLQHSVLETGVMSFSYSAINFRSSAEFGTFSPTIKEKTHAFFHAFIEQLSHDVFDFADEILKKPSLMDYFKLDGAEMRNRRERFTNLVFELLEAASYGTESPAPHSLTATREQETSTERLTKRTGGASLGGSLGLGLKGPEASGNAKLNIGSESSLTDKRRQTENLTFTVRRKFNPQKIKSLLVDIVELLGLDYLVIFVDEWMSLGECQIEFAERLKRCLFGSPRISVKIAADPYQGKFNNAGQGYNFRGIEVGGDVFEAVDLDLPFRNPQRRGPLFAEALFKRLAFWEPELCKIFGQPPNWNANYFIESVFSSTYAFDELCIASQGLCRKFHLLFQLCSKRIGWDLGKKKIDTATVRDVIYESTEQTYGRVITSIDSNKLLFNVIRPHIINVKSRYFLTASIPGEYTQIINNLLSQRIIHQLPMSHLHPSIRGEFECYEVDYGIFLDIARAMEFSTGESIDRQQRHFKVEEITSANKNMYLLAFNAQSLQQSGSRMLLCGNCQQEFPSDAKAYQVRRICPHCFSDQ